MLNLKHLIVNADDFGVSMPVNKGIIAGHKKGIITSTSILANSPCFEESVKMLKENPTLKVGVHLNITSGKAVSNLKNLVNKNNNFKFYNQHLLGLYLIDNKEVAKELNAQIKRVVKAGIKPDHINGHSHIHIFPYILDLIIKLAKKYKIKKIRLPIEKGPIKFGRQTWKYYMLNYYAKRSQKRFNKAGLDYSNHFYGLFLTGNPTKDYFLNILNNLEKGFTEIMVHPGYIDHNKKDWVAQNRLNELKILTDKDIKHLIEKNQIDLTNFGRIK
ncbi:MAG: ChbG/HpnK family deacetylase [archaeon]